MEAPKPSHIRPDGSLAMVDVAAKAVTQRSATARAIIKMSEAAQRVLSQGTAPKGDALVAAQLAGIMAAKKTDELIPLAHRLALSSVDVTFAWPSEGTLCVEATARTAAQTGVELEAMVAVSIAALTVYDMMKAVDKGIVIEQIRLLEKSGGKSGTWTAPA